MAIEFFCECGKQLRAREQFAGRRMKCPDCAKVLTIPAGSMPALAEPPMIQVPAATVAEATPAMAPAAAETPAEPDWFAAAVAEIEVADEGVGDEAIVHESAEAVADDITVAEVSARPPLVPDMLADVEEPAPFSARAAKMAEADPDETLPLMTGYAPPAPPAPLARPVARQRGKPDPWTERSLEQRPTPWRDGDRERFQPGPEPRERSFGWLKVLILLLIVGGMIFGLQRVPSLAERAARWEALSDLDLVPSPAAAVLAVRLGDIWNTPKGAALRTALAPVLAKSIQDDLLIEPADIERVTLIVGEPQPFAMPMPNFPGKGNFKKGIVNRDDQGIVNKGAAMFQQAPKGKGMPKGMQMPKGMKIPKGMQKGPKEPPPDPDLFDRLLSDRHLLIVRTRGPIDYARLNSLGSDKYQFRHRDQTVQLLNSSRLPGACLLIVNSRTLLVGLKMDIEQTLDELDTPRPDRLTVEVTRAGDKHVILVHRSRPMSKVLPKKMQGSFKRMMPGSAHGLLDVRATTLTLHDGAQGLEAEARLTFTDKAAAARVAEAIPAAATTEPAAWARFSNAAPSHFRPLLQQLGAAMLSNVTIQPNEAELTLTINRKKGNQ